MFIFVDDYIALCGSSYEAQPVALADVDITAAVDVAGLTVADAVYDLTVDDADLTVADAAAYFA